MTERKKLRSYECMNDYYIMGLCVQMITIYIYSLSHQQRGNNVVVVILTN